MTDNSGSAGQQAMPCVDQPMFSFFDTNEDGILSVEELRAAAPDNAQLQELVARLEAAGIPGIQYTGCSDASSAGAASGEVSASSAGATGSSVAEMIARAAVEAIGGRQGQ